MPIPCAVRHVLHVVRREDPGERVAGGMWAVGQERDVEVLQPPRIAFVREQRRMVGDGQVVLTEAGLTEGVQPRALTLGNVPHDAKHRWIDDRQVHPAVGRDVEVPGSVGGPVAPQVAVGVDLARAGDLLKERVCKPPQDRVVERDRLTGRCSDIAESHDSAPHDADVQHVEISVAGILDVRMRNIIVVVPPVANTLGGIV